MKTKTAFLCAATGLIVILAGCEALQTSDSQKANVIYSGWINAAFSRVNTSSLTVTQNPTSYVATVVAPPITQSVLDSAAIHVYWKPSAAMPVIGGRVVPLPHAQASPDGEFVETMAPVFSVGKIEMWSNMGLLTSQQTGVQQFRYVIVFGEEKSGRRAAIDWNDYEQVRQRYNLPE